MPYRRRAPVRRRMPFRKRRIIRRRRRMPMRNNPRKPFLYKQSYTLANLDWPSGTGPGATPGLAYSFNVNSLPNITAFSGLYDEYKICAVKFTYIPTVNQAYPSQPTYIIHSIIDWDDQIAEVTVDQMYQYQTHRVHRGTKVWSRYLKPRFNMLVSTGSTTANGFSSRRGWLDLAVTTIPHYGVKIFCEYPDSLGAGQGARIIVTMYVAFRNVR